MRGKDIYTTYYTTGAASGKPFHTALLLAMLMPATVSAQESACLSPQIKTLQVKVDGTWGSNPVLMLKGGHSVEISFDNLQASYQRYKYTITHCNADWQPSDLLTSEYMTGFNDTQITDYEPAIGTEMNYCHYSFTLPNEENQLLVSGNYKVTIYSDETDSPVAEACFSIMDPRMGVDINVSSNTDIDTYAQHQQVSFSVNYSGYRLNDPIGEMKYVVTQNRRWDNHASGLRPSSMQVNKLIFEHNRALIFEAGNEYRRFEILDPYVPTMNVETMEYDDTYYHAYLYTDKQRINYLYDEDQDGRFFIRNGNDDDADTASDYFITHFTLQMPQAAGGDVYLFGDMTGNRIDPAYQMQYNTIDHQYELAVPLKQGSYNYMYMCNDGSDMAARTQPCEGNFHLTENEYSVYVYHRPFGSRYDMLVGYNTLRYKE